MNENSLDADKVLRKLHYPPPLVSPPARKLAQTERANQVERALSGHLQRRLDHARGNQRP